MSQQTEWDIVSGVGITALWVAAARAAETNRPNALIFDPYAEAFVQAANPPTPIPTRLDEAPNEGIEGALIGFSPYMAVRTKFFDEFFVAAGATGVRQVVIFASGLDTRAFRLEWPPDTTVYELDMPRVLEFKDQVLAEQGARPRCWRRTIGIDLREDWLSALRQAGFNPLSPTAWLAEGLLPYLPDEAKVKLFSQMNELSAVGSRVAIEHLPNPADAIAMAREKRPDLQKIIEEFVGLIPAESSYDPEQELASYGWKVSLNTILAVAAQYNWPLDESVPFRQATFLITAVK